MKDRYEAVMNFISEAEIALAKARAEIAFERLDKAMEPPPAVPIVPPQRPVAALHDEPPSRPA